MVQNQPAYRDRLSKPRVRYRLQKWLAPLSPWYRLIRRRTDYWRALRRADHPKSGRASLPVAFIVGSGRSGTTLLGALLAAHPDIAYVFEPWHLWTAINPLTDSNNFHEQINALCIMDGSHWDESQTARFDSLIRRWKRSRGSRVVVEKSPINAMRIGYLEMLAPGSRYIHIARDGGDVARSIARIAGRPPYRVGRRQLVNHWWGVDESKWRALARDGAAAGHFPEEVEALDDGYGRGAYEWLVSIREVERHRGQLADRILDVRYHDLIHDPQSVMTSICDFLGLPIEKGWLKKGRDAIRPRALEPAPQITLPPHMAQAFNELQAELGFPTRAQKL